MAFEANDMAGTTTVKGTASTEIMLGYDGALANRIYFRLIQNGEAPFETAQANSAFAVVNPTGKYVFVPKSRAAVRRRLLKRFISRTAKFVRTDYGPLEKTL